MCLIFNPLISIFPSLQISRILVKAFNKVDLPDPVLPTMPIFSPWFILNDTPFKTNGVFSLYLMSISWAWISPYLGQFSGGFGKLKSASSWPSSILRNIL